MGAEGKHTTDRGPRSGSESGHASQSTRAPGATGFLDLSEKARQDIYKRVLAMEHPVYLFQDVGPRVETFAPDKPKWWLALLYTNKQVYREAKTALYGRNCFFLMDRPQQQDALLGSFLNCIGCHNAELLSRLCISFPVLEDKAQSDQCQGQQQVPRAEMVRIRQDSIRNLGLLQSSCTNLATLEMQISKENSRCLAEVVAADGGGGGRDEQFVRVALLRIEAQLDAIPSLENIVVRLHVKDLAPVVIDIMQELGWVVLNG
jgi:hypothetical protein